jgi:hypothetical protein
MRHFSAVLEVSALTMTGQDLPLGSSVALQFIGDDYSRGIPQPTQQLAEEALGSFGIAPALHKDVEHLAILIDSQPEIMLLAADADKHLIEEPFVARPWAAAPQCVGEHPAEPQAPVTDAFVADDDAAGGQDQFDVTQAEVEAVIQSDGVLDDLGGKSKATMEIGRSHHAG